MEEVELVDTRDREADPETAPIERAPLTGGPVDDGLAALATTKYMTLDPERCVLD